MCILLYILLLLPILFSQFLPLHGTDRIVLFFFHLYLDFLFISLFISWLLFYSFIGKSGSVFLWSQSPCLFFFSHSWSVSHPQLLPMHSSRPGFKCSFSICWGHRRALGIDLSFLFPAVSIQFLAVPSPFQVARAWFVSCSLCPS